jgi:UDP-glucose 4-epimerase
MKRTVKRVLVTGGAGCIGLQVCRELLDRGIEVVLFDLPEQVLRLKSDIPEEAELHYGSILDCSSLRDAMAGCDAVLHLAAYLGVRRTEMNRLRCIEINVNGTKNVLDIAVQHRVGKVLLASSSEVYGEPVENPITELTPVQGKTVYAVTKLVGEELCKAYNQRYPELSFTILRYFNTYGPSQIAQFVVPKFIRNVMEGQPPVIYGDGKQVRSYCFASDTAWATVEALLSEEADGETFNVGNSSNPVSLADLAELVVDVCGKKGEIEPRFERKFEKTDRTEEREIFRRFCDTSKAARVLKYAPQVTLEEGIRKMVEHGTIFSKWESTDMTYTIDE